MKRVLKNTMLVVAALALIGVAEPTFAGGSHGYSNSGYHGPQRPKAGPCNQGKCFQHGKKGRHKNFMMIMGLMMAQQQQQQNPMQQMMMFMLMQQMMKQQSSSRGFFGRSFGFRMAF